MIRASRALNDNFDVFRETFDRNVTVKVPDANVRTIWEQESSSGGFAVNGELTQKHWSNEIALFYQLNPKLRRVTLEEVIAGDFVAAALDTLDLV
jgi:hypothetical protein